VLSGASGPRRGGGERPAQALGHRGEVVDVGPDPADHPQVAVADLVFAQLLGHHDVGRVLTRLQQSPVLDQAVELADGAQLRPAEVDLQHPPVALDPPLQDGSGQACSQDRQPAAGLADAVAAAVGHRDDLAGLRRPRPPRTAAGGTGELVTDRREQGMTGTEHRRCSRRGDVGTAPESMQLTGLPLPAQLLVGQAAGDQLAAKKQAGGVHAAGMPPRHPAPGPNGGTHCSHTDICVHAPTAVDA
jgi:hypothetical protein